MGELPEGTRASRARWLGHPAFLLCVAVLAVNDRVLKYEHPGWWTGKLSDVAGVALAGVLVSVVVGARVGLPLAGALFVVLKTVPGGAELAAPILGGITRRDPTDLLALVALLPLRRCLVTRSEDARPPWHRPTWRLVPASAAPLLGALVAIGATTATARCDDSTPPEVVYLTADGSTLQAVVWDGRDLERARSDDGGRSWSPDNGENFPIPRRLELLDLGDEAVSVGPTSACLPAGPCWRLVGGNVIERGSDEDGWVREHPVDANSGAGVASSCASRRTGTIVATDGDDGPSVVASTGDDGVLHRTEDGSWASSSVLSSRSRGGGGDDDDDPGPTMATMSQVLLWFGPVLALVVGLAVRSRTWVRGVVVTLVGWIVTSAAAGVAFVATDMGMAVSAWEEDPSRSAVVVQVIGLLLTVLAVFAVTERSPHHPTPHPNLEPPNRAAPPR
jgi:hypothetical protein